MISTHWHGRGDVISDCPRVVSDQRDQISELNVAKRQPNQFLLCDIFQNSPNSCCHTFGHHLKETLSPRTFKKLPNHWSHCWWRQQQTATRHINILYLDLRPIYTTGNGKLFRKCCRFPATERSAMQHFSRRWIGLLSQLLHTVHMKIKYFCF